MIADMPDFPTNIRGLCEECSSASIISGGYREFGTPCTEYSYTLTVHFQFQFSIIDEMRIDIYLNLKKSSSSRLLIILISIQFI